MTLYRQEIIERWRYPRHRGVMQSPDSQGERVNAFCGDEITLFLRLDEKKKSVCEARFTGEGCALMVASADMLCEAIEGKIIDEARRFSADELLLLYGEPPTPGRLGRHRTSFAERSPLAAIDELRRRFAIPDDEDVAPGTLALFLEEEELPRLAATGVPYRIVHADLEAYAAAYEAQYGEAIPLAVLITTIVRDYLQKDQAFMRQRRQAAATPQARATPNSAETRPRGPDSRDGALSRP